MRLSSVGANLICAALVVVDQLARTWRIQALASGLGHRTHFGRVFAVNVTSDAAAALTPLRMGGEPARLAGIRYCGVPVPDVLALVTVEGTLEYAVVIAIAVYVGSAYGSAWWATTRARLVPAAHRIFLWVVLTAFIGLALWVVLRRVAPRLFAGLHGTLRTSLRNARRISWWAVIVSLPLTIAHVVGRLAVLPVLMLTVSGTPEMGAVWFGSFTLLYGQLFLPTPSGAGAIDMGFLNGAAGYVGPDAAALLLVWRFYTTVTGIILGVIFGVPYYGDGMRRWLVRRRQERQTVHGDGGP